MRPILSVLAAFALAIAVPGPAAAQQARGSSSGVAPGPAVAALQDLYNGEWKWRQAEFGYQTEDGEWKSADHFPSNTPEAWARRTAYWEQVLRKLDAIELALLPHEEQVNAAVFRADVEALYNNATWRTWEAPFN